MDGFETERLQYRKLMMHDAQDMFELDSDPEVARFVGNKPVTTLAQSEEVIKFVQQQYADNGIGRWAVIEKASGEFIGWAGLKLIREKINDKTGFYDLGYRLKRKFWGMGYATEAAKAWIKYGFEKMELAELIAMAHTENAASLRVLKKCGFIAEDNFFYDKDPHIWLRLMNEKTA